MRSETVYAIRWRGLWWSGREWGKGMVDQVGSPFLKDARFFSDPETAGDVAQELGGTVQRVDMVVQ